MQPEDRDAAYLWDMLQADSAMCWPTNTAKLTTSCSTEQWPKTFLC